MLGYTDPQSLSIYMYHVYPATYPVYEVFRLVVAGSSYLPVYEVLHLVVAGSSYLPRVRGPPPRGGGGRRGTPAAAGGGCAGPPRSPHSSLPHSVPRTRPADDGEHMVVQRVIFLTLLFREKTKNCNFQKLPKYFNSILWFEYSEVIHSFMLQEIVICSSSFLV